MLVGVRTRRRLEGGGDYGASFVAAGCGGVAWRPATAADGSQYFTDGIRIELRCGQHIANQGVVLLLADNGSNVA